jgi:hypothetical protein
MKNLFLLLLIVLVTAGCSQSPTDSTPTVIMPLEIGNQWIGRVTSDSTGAVLVPYDTLTILREVVIDNETWYETNKKTVFINRANGLTWKDSATAECACFRTVEYPAHHGDTVHYPTTKILLPGTQDPVDKVHGKLITRTPVSVPAGTYECLHYRYKIFSPEGIPFISPFYTRDEKYYSPNVGPILTIHDDRRWELLEVTLN